MIRSQVAELIDNLVDSYSPQLCREIESHGIGAVEPLLTLLGYLDFDPALHDTVAEILINILLQNPDGEGFAVLDPLRRHPNIAVRRRVMGALQHFPTKDALSALHEGLNDHDEEVQHAAAFAIVARKYSSSDEISTYTAALNDDHPHVRYIAVKSLEFLHATHGMTEALKNDSATIRRIAVYYLGRMRLLEALDSLIEALSDSDFEVRLGAVWALGEIGSAQAVNAVRLMATSSDEHMVRTVGEALHKLGYRRR